MRDYDPVAELAEVLRACGARPTMDAARNVTLPCVLCGESKAPRTLVKIGTYTRRMGGNLQPGDAITRPMCQCCVKLTTAHTLDPQRGGEGE